MIVFPTWVLVRFYRRFLPETHPWKSQKITLTDWAEKSTYLNKQFSVFFWIAGIAIIEVITILKFRQ